MRIAGNTTTTKPRFADTDSIPQGAVFVGTVGGKWQGVFIKGEGSKFTRLANTAVAHDPNRKDAKGNRVDHIGNIYTKGNRTFSGKVYLNPELALGDAAN